MNDVEKLLSTTADDFERALANDPALANEFVLLLKNGQEPNVMRVLRDVPGGVLLLRVQPEPK